MNKLLFAALLLVLGGGFTGVATMSAQTKICVISDIHYFDPALLVNDGTAFQTYLAYDRKMLKESGAILESVLTSIKAQAPDVLLISGDLTKDGEKSGHQKLATLFQALEDDGIQVVVTPGNHDVYNPHAQSYDGDVVSPVDDVSPDEFKSIYGNFGFNQATATHDGSLSFVYPLSDDLVLISMDVCRYADNITTGSPETAGGFTSDLLSWVKTQIAIAKTNGKTVIGMMHHGLLEHYTGQKNIMGEYVIDDWNNISTQLADAGMQAVFTGHYHAQDMVMKSTGSHFIYDIETGSTVTFPCPYRTAVFDNTLQTFSITGNRVQSINYDLGGKDFQTYARNFIETGLPLLVKGMLMNAPYYLSADNATPIEPAITETFIAHYEGNEGDPSSTTQYIISSLISDVNYASIGAILQGMWNDISPDDWTYTINLTAVPTLVTRAENLNLTLSVLDGGYLMVTGNN